MIRFFSRPGPLVVLLLVLSAIPIITAVFKVVQIPTGTLPEDSLRLNAAPVSIWLHALAGILFALLGPLQFARALKARFGGLHRFSGRVFVLAGVALGLSGLSLILQLDGLTTPIVDIARAIFSVLMIVTLGLGVRAAMARHIVRHRAWMIRSYAIGMGGNTVGLVLFPVYLAGGPVTGLVADLVFVGWWLIALAIAEWVIRRVQGRQVRPLSP